MSDLMMRSNPALDRAIEQAKTPNEITEVIKAHLAGAGLLGNERGDDYGVRLTRPIPGEMREQSARPTLDLSSKPTDTCVRVVYPHLNDRVEITGASEEELDAKERQLRAMFGER